MPPEENTADCAGVPLEDSCPRCGEKALVKVQAAGFKAFGGAIECTVCTARTAIKWDKARCDLIGLPYPPPDGVVTSNGVLLPKV